MRTDLVPPSNAQALADYLAYQAGRYDTTGAIIAVIGGTPTTRQDSLPREDLVRRVTDTFTANDIPVGYSVWASSTRHGAPWHSYADNRTGTVPDPTSTPVAAMAVVTGKVAFGSREALAAILMPNVEPTVLERRAITLLDEIGIAAVERLLGRDTTARAGLAVVRRAVERATNGDLPTSDGQVVPLAVALSDPRVAEVCMALSLGDHADAAEQVWLTLVRGVPVPYRAEPAVLLAVSAYLRGNGAMAHIALDNAEDAKPRHPFAQLLRRVLNAGLPPADFAAVIAEGAGRNPLLRAGQ